MSEENIQSVNVRIHNATFAFTEVTEAGRKTKDKPNPLPTIYVAPVLGSNAERAQFVAALLDAAEANKAGSSEALWDKLVKKHLRDVSDVVYDKDGAVHAEKIPAALVAVRHSTGITEDQLAALERDLNIELMEVMPLVVLQSNDPAAFNAKIAELGYDEDSYALKVLSIQNRLADVAEKRAKAESDKAARAAKRKARETAAAV